MVFLLPPNQVIPEQEIRDRQLLGHGDSDSNENLKRVPTFSHSKKIKFIVNISDPIGHILHFHLAPGLGLVLKQTFHENRTSALLIAPCPEIDTT